MVAVAEAQELEEDLGSVEASVGDLVGVAEAEVMAGKTWDFGPLLMTKKVILELEKDGYVP
jgi:hypothetical protein